MNKKIQRKGGYLLPLSSILVLFLALLTSCQDDLTQSEYDSAHKTNLVEKQDGMQRIVFSSPDEIESIISQMNEGGMAVTRAISSATASLSNNTEPFVSLIETNRTKVMESLTTAQLDSIANDEEELEFCPADSVIADIQFAQLLNADREIQVGQTVYKYVPNGVAYTDVKNAKELKNIENTTKSISVTEENEGVEMQVSSAVKFRPIQYQATVCRINNNSNNSTTATSTKAGITLSNGYTIPLSDIRDINYYDKGDGNWLHRAWTGIWGRNVVAIKKFSKRRKLTMNFYDQNYIVYANIGTKLKMQKKVCGIWWNIKAQEMVQGWETVTIKYTMPKPTLQMFTNPFNNKQEYPSYTWNPFPYGKNNVLLFNIPFVNYDFTTNDLNKAFHTGLQYAWKKATSAVKGLINNDSKKAGLMSFNNNDFYVIYGPYSESHKNVRSVKSNFYAKKFSGTCEFGFSVGSSLKLSNVKLSTNDGVELSRGVVYGAIKYNGKWLGARITKDRDKK